METTMSPRFQVQIANKIEKGRAVGTLWLAVDLGETRRQHIRMLECDDETRVRNLVALCNQVGG